MNDFSLVLSSLKSRWLNSLLSVFLTAFGVMLALLIVQFGSHIQDRLSTDGKGIDIVIGAKGSPLQLILSSVYHIDIPTGNIAYEDAQKWMKHPHVRTAIPLALGDNWKGHRIVGTTFDYMGHYNAELRDGREWNTPYEVVIGSDVGMSVGDKFTGSHGLLSSDGHAHENSPYTVTGVMARTGSVLDRLILTSLDSVLDIHGYETIEAKEHGGHDDHAGHDHGHNHGHDDHEGHEDHGDHAKEKAKAEITAILLTTKTPIANINLPRSINRDSALQAANPALEMARLTAMLGLGTKSFTALSALLIVISALSIFAGLAGSLENRMGDLAVLRAIGYSKLRIFKIITLEGMAIVVGGIILGFSLGAYGFSMLIEIIKPLGASGAHISMNSEFLLIIFAVLIAGLIAAMLPAYRASRIDVAEQLSRNA